MRRFNFSHKKVVCMGAKIFHCILLILFLGGACTAIKHTAYESFDRDSWQHPDRVIQSLNIRPGNQIADLGSGDGYFTFRLAGAVGPSGKVYAVDINKSMNELVIKRAKEKRFRNIKTILAKMDDPLLPKNSVDLIFSSNSYHHLKKRTAYFVRVKKYLRPKGRVAIIDFKKGAFHHFTEGGVILRKMQAAGYHLQEEFDFLPRQHFMVFSK